MAAFSSCVLQPLEWARLLGKCREEQAGKQVHRVFKTSLWRNAMKLDTDYLLQSVTLQ